MSSRLSAGERRAGADGILSILRNQLANLPPGHDDRRAALEARIARLEQIAAHARAATVAAELGHGDGYTPRERRDTDS